MLQNQQSDCGASPSFPGRQISLIAYERRSENRQENHPSYKMQDDLSGPPYACLSYFCRE